jgi:hypothetical protein
MSSLASPDRVGETVGGNLTNATAIKAQFGLLLIGFPLVFNTEKIRAQLPEESNWFDLSGLQGRYGGSSPTTQIGPYTLGIKSRIFPWSCMRVKGLVM